MIRYYEVLATIIVILGLSILITFTVTAENLGAQLSGRILLQVEDNGEAWYVNPANQLRYFLGSPTDAFSLMQKLGIGISNANLEKIPKADSNQSIDLNFAQQHKGKIFLQVEEKGEAWYVNPTDLKRYYLGKPADAFQVMKTVGLGIKNKDLEKITTSTNLQKATKITELNNVQATTSSNKFNSLNNELQVLIDDENIIGDDHFNRINKDIQELEAKGITNINQLKEKLTILENRQTGSQTAESTSVTSAENSLPACTNQKYSAYPIELNQITKIYPLGSLNPPGHTLPTEHIYFHISPGQTTTELVDLKAPGDIYITEIISSSDDVAPKRTEYTINFALCDNVRGYYNHVKDLSAELLELLESADCQQFTVNPGNLCSKIIFYQVNAGTVIGSVGHLQGNFDLGTLDDRQINSFVNQERYQGSRTENIVCPLKYYELEKQASLYAKLFSTDLQSCGKVAQDKKGTIQGNWFFDDGATSSDEGNDSWNKHLGFLENNIDPAQSVISIGGTFTSSGKWEFIASHTGLTNRSFEEATVDNNIYCYQVSNQTGKILVQLINDQKLQIEYQTGSCTEENVFTDPYIYIR